jgi:outer membrane protein assembly factor BamB
MLHLLRKLACCSFVHTLVFDLLMAACSAYVYSAPTLVDLNHDGKLEILLATSVGFVYALNHLGQSLPGWPVQMGEVQAQVAAADVDGDGYVEIFAVDTRGSVACFNVNGTLRWDVHLRTSMTQAPTLGDVNGDGRLDVVMGGAAGEVFALDAATGAPFLPDA